MGDRLDKITKRVKRLFGGKKPESPPKKLTASQIICPESAVEDAGKDPPKSTRRTRRFEHLETTTGSGLVIAELPWGVTHVVFPQADPSVSDDTIAVRDPVTRRLSRKKLTDGMKRTTGYYDESGVLFDETNTDW